MRAAAPTGLRIDVLCEQAAAALRILGGTGTLLDAAELYRKQRGNITPTMVTDIVADYEKRIEGKSAVYKRDVRLRLGRFAKAFATYIHSITAKDIERWINGFHLGSRSRNNFRALLITLFKYAQKQGYIAAGVTEAEKVEELNTIEDECEIGIFTSTELRRLLTAGLTYKQKPRLGKLIPASNKSIIAYLALGAFAGIRSAEIARLQWSNINLQTGYITIEKKQAKTKRISVVTMPQLIPPMKHQKATVMLFERIIVELTVLGTALKMLRVHMRPAYTSSITDVGRTRCATRSSACTAASPSA
ncbi:hypothetical protein DB346_13010, partial [Verrucomicrobia bacterium LW23]